MATCCEYLDVYLNEAFSFLSLRSDIHFHIEKHVKNSQTHFAVDRASRQNIILFENANVNPRRRKRRTKHTPTQKTPEQVLSAVANAFVFKLLIPTRVSAYILFLLHTPPKAVLFTSKVFRSRQYYYSTHNEHYYIIHFAYHEFLNGEYVFKTSLATKKHVNAEQFRVKSFVSCILFGKDFDTD